MDAQGSQTYAVTLRGFSPRELSWRAERQCAMHFGADRFLVEEARCVPCMCSLGGHVRLYEAHLVVRVAAPGDLA